MIKRKYIVAGNYEQFRAYIRKKNDINTEYIYVDSPNKLKGLSEIEGYYIGTYYNRPDIQHIKEIIRITKAFKAYNSIPEFKPEYSVEFNAKDMEEYLKNWDTVKEEIKSYNSIDVNVNSFNEFKPAEDSVYGNVTGIKRDYRD